MRFIKTLVLVVVFLLIWSCLSVGAHEASLRFEGYRINTLATLDVVLEKHPECQLGDLYHIIEVAKLNFFEDEDTSYRATAVAGNGNFRILFNLLAEWNDENSKVTIFHETFHLAKICGPDAVTRRRGIDPPICVLFGQEAYSSQEISKLIRVHLREDLERN